MAEKQVDQRLKREIERRGGVARKLTWTAVRGGPDRDIYMPYGFRYLVELKNGDKGVLSVHQIARHRELAALGTKVWIVKDEETLNEFLKQVDKDQATCEV